jgi:hypothetical protein
LHARAPPPAAANRSPSPPTSRAVIWERHRHRYEVNPEFVPALEASGLHFTGTDDRGIRMEIIELDRSVHPFFFAVQYHPEFQSQPHRPSPPFLGLIYAAAGELERNLPLPISASRRDKGLASADGGLDAPAAGAAASSPPRSLNSSLLTAGTLTPPGEVRAVAAAAATAGRGSAAVAHNSEVTSSSIVAPIERSPLKAPRSAADADALGARTAHPPAVNILLAKD